METVENSRIRYMAKKTEKFEDDGRVEKIVNCYSQGVRMWIMWITDC